MGRQLLHSVLKTNSLKIRLNQLSSKLVSALNAILYYKIQSVCVCVCVCEYVCMLVRNRLQNHAYYGDEAFAGDSVGLGLGQRLN